MEFEYLSISIVIVFVFGSTYMLIKNVNTYTKQSIILNAIYAYIRTMIAQGNYECVGKVTFDDMENYTDTLLRFWDWGYTRILPKEKFEIIKPYIKKGA